MRSNINPSSQKIKAQISFMIETIAKKNALNISILQLMIVVRMNEWVTQATKYSKRLVIRIFLENDEIG
jgi:hypothetical protein